MKKLSFIVLLLTFLSCSKSQLENLKGISKSSEQFLPNQAASASVLFYSDQEFDAVLFESLNENQKVLFYAILEVIKYESPFDINPGYYFNGLNQLHIDFANIYSYSANSNPTNSGVVEDNIIIYTSTLYSISSASSAPDYKLYEEFRPTSGFRNYNQLMNVIKINFHLDFDRYEIPETYFYVTKHLGNANEYSHYSLKPGFRTYVEERVIAYDQEAEVERALAEALKFTTKNANRECSKNYTAYQNLTGHPMSLVKITPCHVINSAVK
ncbi:hypothetical protein [Sphingobacterium paludis]|uniref:Lipoprotein n=1 Tax=Sphingobacterium paludis TaxID=1476465 RepID=A0A4R7D125_9SPHI|nr:hypothetical protein [Sphingobacterium paludis]TDS12476.1 hypothetical protein B0I21_106335 [Sphingobacterium paludis]